MPVWNETGKYHVKLKFLDTFYKVEVDDCFPISLLQNRSVLPLESNRSNIWCMLILKAVLKFFNKIPKNDKQFELNNELNANMIYSLTGFLNVEFFLSDRVFVTHELNPLLKSCLADEAYFGNKIRLIAMKDSDACIEVNELSVPEYNARMSSKSLRNGSEIKNQLNITRELRIAMMNLNEENRLKPVNKFLSYSLHEYFENEDFNLAFARDFTEEEFIIHRKYEQMLTVKTHFMNKEDIIKLKKQRRELRMKLKEIEKIKIDFINKSNRALSLVSLCSTEVLDKNTNFGQCFSAKEIQIAKTCKKYALSRPPNFVDINDLKWEEGSIVSTTKQNIKDNDNSNANFSKSLSDFTSIENGKLCENRTGYQWVQTGELMSLFNKLIVLYNPNNFSNRETIKVKEEDNGSIDENKEVLIVKENSDNNDKSPLEMLVNIQFIDSNPELNFFKLLIYDFEKFESVQEMPLLTGINKTIRVRLSNENQTFRLKLVCQSKAILTVYSNSNLKFCSVSSYLTEVENWKESKIKVTSGFLNARFHSFFQKTSLISEENQHLIFYFPVLKIQPLKNVLKFDLIKIDEETPLEMNKRIEKNNECLSVQTNLYENIKIQKGSYVLVSHCLPLANFPERNFEVLMFTKKEIKVESIDNWQSGEIIDQYIPNKYGQIFKEDLYFKHDCLQLSLTLEIKELISSQPPVTNDKKTLKVEKTETDLENYAELEKTQRVFIEVYKNDTLLNVFVGNNGVKIKNFQIENTDPDIPIMLIAKFVTTPDSKILTMNPFSKNINWILKLWTNSPICIIKNTKKEELENNVIRSWETKDQGRAEKAMKLRLKNIAISKEANGEILTEKEQQFLNEDFSKFFVNSNKTNQPQKTQPAKTRIDPKQNNVVSNMLEFLENPSLIKPLQFFY